MTAALPLPRRTRIAVLDVPFAVISTATAIGAWCLLPRVARAGYVIGLSALFLMRASDWL